MKISKHSKKLALALSATISVFGIGIAVAGAEGYVPLAPLPGVQTGPEGTSLASYLNAIFKIGIGLAGVFAVLMLVIAGIEYIGGAGSPSARKDANKRIWNAIFGIMLALGAWLILNTINPELLKTELNIQPVAVPATQTGETAGGNATQAEQWCFVARKITGKPIDPTTDTFIDNCSSNESACKGAKNALDANPQWESTTSCAKK